MKKIVKARFEVTVRDARGAYTVHEVESLAHAKSFLCGLDKVQTKAVYKFTNPGLAIITNYGNGWSGGDDNDNALLRAFKKSSYAKLS